MSERSVLPQLAACASMFWSGLEPSMAAGVSFRILDRDGQPVPEVVVWLASVESDTRVSATGDAPALMNQRDLAFHPHVLVVQTGTTIRFPNEDDVRHHVYSFSKAKRFDFTVDSGDQQTHELIFDRAGIVTLGCNIHDGMLGFIIAVDTPHYAMTDSDGIADIGGVGAGEYEIRIFTPRVAEKRLPQPEPVRLTAGQTLEFEYQFESRLYAPHADSDTSLIWQDY